MTITRGEFTRFSTRGRMQLLAMYGTLLLWQKIKEQQLSLYSLADFYVTVTRCLADNSVIAAEPVICSMANYYLGRK